MSALVNRHRFGTGAGPAPEASLRARARRGVAEEVTLPTVARMWTPGPLLDQGRLGACGGFATTAELIAEPEPDVVRDAALANQFGVSLYQRARVLSGLPPMPDGTGSTGSMVDRNLQACVERGLFGGYRFLHSPEEVASVVVNEGPVVIALPWVKSLEQTDRNGLMRYDPASTNRGHHALCITGYDPAKVLLTPPTLSWKWVWKRVKGKRKRYRKWTSVEHPPMAPEPMFRIRNSWSTYWGEVPVNMWGKAFIITKRSGDGWLRLSDLRAMWDAPAADAAYAFAPVDRRPVDLAAVLAAHPDPRVA